MNTCTICEVGFTFLIGWAGLVCGCTGAGVGWGCGVGCGFTDEDLTSGMTGAVI